MSNTLGRSSVRVSTLNIAKDRFLRTSYQLYNPPPSSDGERFKDDGDRSSAVPNTITSEED
jgi:hypothetical protein